MTQLLLDAGNTTPTINRVLVIGGGIGGLALAAGLRRQGFDVAAFERDVDLTQTGGYHITLDPRAQAALAELVEPSVMRRLLASSASVDRRDPDAMWTHTGHMLPIPPAAVTAGSIDVDRITLRLLLAYAVGDDLERGRTFMNFDRHDAGVSAVFDDGTRVEGDILVGADGAHSAVARVLADAPTNQPTGLIGISGRTPWRPSAKKSSVVSVSVRASGSALTQPLSTWGTTIRSDTQRSTNRRFARRTRQRRRTSGARCSPKASEPRRSGL